jgi:hypothetical protein
MKRIPQGVTRAMIGVALVGGLLAVAPPQAGAANGHIHSVIGTSKVNLSGAVENKVSWSFSCDDRTRVTTLKLRNVQVIKADHVSRWNALDIYTNVNSPENTIARGGGPQGDLVQSTTGYGLFGLTSVQPENGVDSCVTGNNVLVFDHDSIGVDFHVQGILS